MVPLYNQALMTLPASGDGLVPLHKEILSVIWSCHVMAETIKKSHLVTSKPLSASLGKGRLQIQHPNEVAEGLRLNLIQKYL
jgi:hypothetical protein